MVDGLDDSVCERVVGNTRQTLSQLSHFGGPPDQLSTYTMVSINSMALLSYAHYFLKGGGARYPYPKEVWTPAGNPGQTPTMRVYTLIRLLL